MYSSPWFYAAIAGVLVIIALATYAGRLLQQLKQQKQAIAEAEKARQSSLAKHDEKILNSVAIIVRAMQEEQCEVSEGCWRLSVLLDSLKTTTDLNQQFPAIFDLYGQIKHMSILEARKQLPKQQRMKQDYERVQIEASLKPAVEKDLVQLEQYTLERISVLKEQQKPD